MKLRILLVLFALLAISIGVNAQDGEPIPIPSFQPMETFSQPVYGLGFDRIEGAEWYEFWVIGPNGYIFGDWFAATDAIGTVYNREGICDTTTCVVRPNVFMNNGNYQWWLRTYGNGVLGEFNTVPNTFDLAIPAPSAPVIVSPEQGSTDNADLQLDLFWSYNPAVQWYNVVIVNPEGDVINGWFASTDDEGIFANIPSTTSGVCSTISNTCGIALTRRNRTTGQQVNLLAGNYQWWVGAWNPGAGSGVYNNGNSYTLQSAGAASFEADTGQNEYLLTPITTP